MRFYISFVALFLLFLDCVYSQNDNLNACDTITSLKEKNACFFKVYKQSQNDLNKTYNSLLSKLNNKIKASKLKEQTRINSFKTFLQNTQNQWILTSDYNAKTHASFELTNLLAENALYRSKTSENIKQNTFLKTLIDSLKIK